MNPRLQMMFVDQIEEVSPDLILVKGEQSIVLKRKGDQEKEARVVLTSSVSCSRIPASRV